MGNNDDGNTGDTGNTQSIVQDKFVFDCDHLLTFCSYFSNVVIQVQTDSILETKLEDLENRWAKLENSYENLMLSQSSEISKELKEKAKENFNACSESYYVCRSHIIDLLKIARVSTPSHNATSRMSLPPQIGLMQNCNNSIKLPPCDTEVFEGSYEKWPSFRDMFTAVYINGTNCPPVVKLYHLRRKTTRDAGAIVKRFPLSDDSFQLAWDALKARYENKRDLVDHLLETLFNIPVATSENSQSLQNIHSTVSDVLQTLKTLNVDTDQCDFIIVFFVRSKLPNETLSLWEQSLKNHRDLIKWSQLEEFLIDRYEAVDRISSMKVIKQRMSLSSRERMSLPSTTEISTQSYNAHERRMSLPSTSELQTQSYGSHDKLNTGCKVCGGDHNLRMCPNFKKFTVQQRIDFVLANKLCNNCLSANHFKAKCPSKHTCYICKMDHHTLLHVSKPNNSQNTNSSTQPPKFISNNSHQVRNASQASDLDTSVLPCTSKQALSSHVQANMAVCGSYILLRTALVHIEHMGELFTVRALIDPGSQRSFVTEKLSKRLGIPTRKSSYDIFGIWELPGSASKECDLVIFSKKAKLRFSVSAIVLPNVTKYVPLDSFEVPHSSDLENLDLADPSFNQRSQIDLVLGNDCERHLYIKGTKKNIRGLASAYNTIFGWVLSGPITTQIVQSFTTSVEISKNADLNDMLRKFWEQEEIPATTLISSEDQYCEHFYEQTTTRGLDGRYVVRLPFKKEFPNSIFLGASRILAIGQYSRMKQSLSKQPELQQQYNAVLEEYLSLGHMEKTSFREVSADDKYFSFYLPHHAVVRPEHKTTKVRVVFNASRKTRSGFSLNDSLYTGPSLQQDLMTVILNWRKYRFVFSGDIQKMYRQILVHPDDRPYQRILFQNEPNGIFQDFQLKTVTFGVNCAPFLAIRTLLQLAHDSETQYPKASSILRKETYVDDILSGGHTIEDALQSQSELISALNSAGFPLKKLTANDSQLLAHLPTDDLYDSNFLQFHESSATKTLGIKWNALTDSFSYSFSPISEDSKVTKRTILSAVAKLFDPAGWITPVVIRAKLLMQQLWLERLDWDQDVSSETHAKWQNLLYDLSHVEDIVIPRWLQYNPKDSIQIHGFADASKGAYCAAVYIRCQTSDFIAFSNLLVAKSKVAPLKTVCLPRLELNGAVLLANLVNHVVNSLSESEVILWTDSSIVLGWLSKPPWTWETYVANRISQIHQLLPNATWRHVPTHDNPADLGTRGCRPLDLKINPLWWHGPAWLTNPPTEWPKRNPLNPPPTQNLAKTVQTFQIATRENDILEQFSSYHKALRVLCYVFRFFNKSISRSRPYVGHPNVDLTQSEVNFVKTRLIMLAQKSCYGEEYLKISDSKPISDKSPLKTLNPFLDSKGILRVNGRLSNSSLPYNERFPIILPGNSRLCQIYLLHLHTFLAHADCNQMCRMTQTEFYNSRLKPRIKNIVNHCKTCLIFKHKHCSQIMAPLPPDRCNLSAPFHTTGIDFAGPFELKTSTLRNAPYIKGYVCVFICFSTKAIHLEACSDLSTAAFRAAFSRFVGRRGLPHRIVSDNGRNFLGASRELGREFAKFIKSASADVAQKYVTHGFEWNFIPPYAPHMGGLWEAAVKSFKFHLKRVAGSHKFNFEEFSTVLARIEGILNSRPISAMSEDPSDITALTPAHFLTGKPIMAFPEQKSNNISIVNRWEKLKALHHQFAIRWREDYLKSLHKRYKWKNSIPNIKPGDLVIIIDDLLPPNEWSLGRIESINPGSDSNVRVADIRTSTGITTRPIVKLCYLPLLNERDT